jgi:cytochrome c biogenesis protein CcmG/thiol:disulfide interchange protein DsbE
MNKFLVPLALFGVLVVFLAIGLTKDPRHVPSPFIGKPAPAFDLPDLLDRQARVSPEDFRGQVWLLNVWGSWCPECWREHQYLTELARQGIPIVGLNWKDEPAAAQDMLRRAGNPYVAIAEDVSGAAGIDWGVYGAPETFVIDQQGVIRYKQVGSVTPELWQEELGPLVRDLQGGAG